MTQRSDALARDVQMYGALSAASVVARYAAKVDEAMSTHSAGEDSWDLAFLVSLAALARESMASFFAGARSERLELTPVTAGHVSTGSLWLHNAGPVPGNGLRLTVSDLVTGGGEAIPGSAVSLSPSSVRDLPVGERREVRLEVAVPAGQTPGWYHGWVFTSPGPDEPVAVALCVEASR